ncbi:hypothetical protein DM02DRAFT_697884 [Periconia macrospinosa]|uniref:Fungal N-terminal domain-containing protein n=1 Tax=Periconia macrospinosa TaxID=97972 RepID=A0A2V1DYT6_9PLEO|nr:hypothetical protein DM02DRAFT_697884 [Periconia macrospinosa]
MAEPVSIIASAITIAGTAAHLSLALFKVAQTFKHAPEEISEIALEISSLSNSLNMLADALQAYHQICRPKMLQEVDTILERFKKIEKQLLNLTSDRGSKTLNRLKWFFDGPKAKSLLKKVESVKTALTLILSIMRVTKEQLQIQHTSTDKPQPETSPLPPPARRNRFRKVLETVIEANRLAVDRARKEDEHQPTEKRRGFNTQLRHFEADADTATWLYYLVFSPQPPPKPFVRTKSLEALNPTVESDNESGDEKTYSQPNHSVKEADERSSVSPNDNTVIVWNKDTETSLVADRLLQSWTVLDTAQIEASKAFFSPELEEKWRSGLMKRIKEYSEMSEINSKAHTIINSAASETKLDMDSKEYTSESEGTSSDDEYRSAEESTEAPEPRGTRKVSFPDDLSDMESLESMRTRPPPTNARKNNSQRYRQPTVPPVSARDRVRAPPDSTYIYGQPSAYSNSKTSDYKSFTPFPPSQYDGFEPFSNTPFYTPPQPPMHPPPLYDNPFSWSPHNTAAHRPPNLTTEVPPPSRQIPKAEDGEETLLSKLEALLEKMEQPIDSTGIRTSSSTDTRIESTTNMREEASTEDSQKSSFAHNQDTIDRLERLILQYGESQRTRHENSEVAWKMAMAKSDALAAENALEERKRSEKEIASAKAAKKAAEKALEFAREQAAERAKKEAEIKAAEQNRMREAEYNQRIKRYEEQLAAFTAKWEEFLQSPRDTTRADIPLRHTAIQEGGRRIEISEYTKEKLEPFITSGETLSTDPSYNIRTQLEDSTFMKTTRPPTSMDFRSMPFKRSLVSEKHVSNTKSIQLPPHRLSSKANDMRNSLAKSGISLHVETSTNLQIRNDNMEDSKTALIKSPDKDIAVIRSSLCWEPPSIPVGSELLSTLKSKGWKPLYTRGSGRGQTYFLGHDPIHVNFFRPEYQPQFNESEQYASDECIIIAKDLVEEYALMEAGFQFLETEAGAYTLDCRLTTNDIEALIERSFMLRETNFRRQHRQLQWAPSSTIPEPVRPTYASTVSSESTCTTPVERYANGDNYSDFADDEQTIGSQSPTKTLRRESDGTDSGFGSMYNTKKYITMNDESKSGTKLGGAGYKGNGPLRLRSMSKDKVHAD